MLGLVKQDYSVTCVICYTDLDCFLEYNFASCMSVKLIKLLYDYEFLIFLKKNKLQHESKEPLIG